MVELLPDIVVLPTCVFLVRLHDVEHHLWVLVLLNFRDAIVREHTLPVFRQPSELTSDIVIANMYHVHGILRSGNLDGSGRPKHAVDEAGKPALLSHRSRLR